MLKSINKKKLLIITGAIVGIIVLIIIMLLIFHALKGHKVTYQEIENKVLKAAQNYYKDNQNLLPQNPNEELSIDDVTLTSLGYLKDLNEMTEEGVNCSAKVVITYNNTKYRYTPLLDCGEKYKSQTLYSYLEENEKRVFSGSGLYDLNGEYVFRGETPNNYIKMSNKMYRIVKLTNNKVVIIYDDKGASATWDNRYNDTRRANDGINDFSVSRIKDALNEMYSGDFITDNDRQLISQQTVYTGKRNEEDIINDGSLEKSEYYEGQYLGILPLYDYINASIDAGCTSSLTKNCRNYNYLNYYDHSWWTSTPDNRLNYKVYRITSDGDIESTRCSSYGYVRPVIYLVSDALYVSGDGTKDNPYIVK